MKSTTVLMFGWEFPPHISGGLGTACYGLTASLLEEKTNILFVVPKAYGDEKIPVINSSDVVMGDANPVESEHEKLVKNPEAIVQIHVESDIVPYTHQHHWEIQDTTTQWNYQFDKYRTKEMKLRTGKRYAFSGTYGPALLDEVNKYSEVAGKIARQYSFDVIHAHDWLTYLAGIEARNESGKPLIVHVHATEYDRAGKENINPQVFEIERKGMQQADRVIAVSQRTKDIIVSRYAIEAAKVEVVHNGILCTKDNDIPFLPKIADQVVTFLGRITWQKGPQYFVEAAWKVLKHFPDVHFIMAGSGDLLPRMIEMVARLKMSDRFHFTGFLKGKQINQVWNVSDVYVMPSVSEPFGITPLEAIHAGVPVIVSNQSGVAEVIDHAIKVDFWDTKALADSMMNILRHKSLSTALKRNSKRELSSITWNRAARKINKMYHELQNQGQAVH
jgi:glycogen(starch) synthase